MKEEPLKDWDYNPKYQQSPVDHFAVDRLPPCSRKRAILVAIFLGFWGVQFFYLRRPGLGWIALAFCKLGIALGLALALIANQLEWGLLVGIVGPVVAEGMGILTAIGLLMGKINTDGRNKPLTH